MFKRHWKRWLIIGSAVIVLVGTTVGIVSAHGGPGKPGGWFGTGDHRDELLAEELDITVDELQAAREAAQAKALEQALEEGKITEEQYEQIQTMAALRPYLDPQTLMADVLGVSVEELSEKTPEEWMEELDLDRETLRERMTEAREAALDQAIADGVITEEEAEDLKERMPGPRGGFEMRPGGPGRGGRGMPRCPGREGLREEAPLEDSDFPMPRFAPGSSS
jgi:transcriptional regulator with XRE-family HTH domain